jgi:hypothetical protein
MRGADGRDAKDLYTRIRALPRLSKKERARFMI